MSPAVPLSNTESFSDVPVVGDGKGSDTVVIYLSLHLLILYVPHLH